jgi:hypothetical protein
MRRTPLILMPVFGLLAVAGPVYAGGVGLPTGNIVQNGGGEAGPAATNSVDSFDIPSWDRLPNFTAVAYGSPQFPTTAISGDIGGGANFFAGGPDNGFGDASLIQQQIDLSGSAPQIDQGNVRARVSADLGGFESQADNASAIVVFGNSDFTSATAVANLAPVPPEERGGQTGFVHRTDCVDLQSGTRTAFVQVLAQRSEGAYNDGYADNVSVVLSTNACPAGEPPPPLAPASPPQPGISGNGAPVSGKILVKQPGSNQFQELSGNRTIPVGSEIDARKGVIRMQTASNASGGTQTGNFSQGRFVMRQRPSSKPTTDLLLKGNLGCKKSSGKASAAGRRSRRLFGNARGRYRSRGRHATATVRGTIWSMRDTCNSTTVRVKRGVVSVRDLRKKKTVRVRRGGKYTAFARRR